MAGNPAVTQPVKNNKTVPIVRQGHTSNDVNGSNVNVKPMGRPATRDLNAK